MAQSSRAAVRATIDTAGLPPDDRFEAWRQALGYGYEVGGAAPGFSAHLSAFRMDDMVISQMTTSPFSLVRSAKQTRDGLEHFVLHLTTAGFAFEGEGGVNGRARVGDITVNDTSQSFVRSRSAERGSIAVAIARTEVEAVLPNASLTHGRILDAQRAGLLGEHLRAMFAFVETAPAGVGRGLSRATALVLAACLRLDMDSNLRAAARPVMEAALQARAKRYIDANLSRHDLKPETLARALGVSRTTLFRLFEPQGGVERHIRQRRLAHARARLQDNDTIARISQIGYEAGFSSPAHFSSAFREAYGVSPSDFRAARRGDDAVSSDFAGLIRSLN